VANMRKIYRSKVECIIVSIISFSDKFVPTCHARELFPHSPTSPGLLVSGKRQSRLSIFPSCSEKNPTFQVEFKMWALRKQR